MQINPVYMIYGNNPEESDYYIQYQLIGVVHPDDLNSLEEAKAVAREYVNKFFCNEVTEEIEQTSSWIIQPKDRDNDFFPLAFVCTYDYYREKFAEMIEEMQEEDIDTLISGEFAAIEITQYKS